MELQQRRFFDNYGNIILLLVGIVIGSAVGLWFPDATIWLKPVGDIFLNLLFTAVIPLLFFAITSAIANIDPSQKLGRIVSVMAAVFLATVVIAAVVTIVALWFFPVTAPPKAGNLPTDIGQGAGDLFWGDQLVQFVTVSEFSSLLSRQHMLAFVIFSFLTGMATLRAGEKGKAFRTFLASGNEVMAYLLTFVMKLAPLGLGAYFAFQVGVIGSDLFAIYAKPLGLYYIVGLFYFILFFTLYAFVAFGSKGVKTYWRYNILPSATAISTCSSLATMPVNIQAAKKMGIPKAVANVVVPLGTTLHKNGSSISSIVKIYVAFVLMGWEFFDPMTLLSAIGITVLVSIVAGGIPSGGYIGEMLMISIYGIPDDIIPTVIIIGTLVDPMATLLNATGDTVAAMLVTRFGTKKGAVLEEAEA